MSAVAWIATRLYDGRLLTDRTLLAGAACWCVARVRALRSARVARRLAVRPSLRAHAHRDPRHSSRETVRGAAGARLEPAPVMKDRTTRPRRGAGDRRPAAGPGPDRGRLLLRPESQQRLHRLLGADAGLPAVCTGELRPRASPTPLVISLHGAGLWGAAQKDISQWNTVADREGFIVVYPSGARDNGPGHLAGRDRTGRHADVTFISDLIDKLSAGLQHRSGEDLRRTDSPTAAAWRSFCPARSRIGSRPSGWWRRRICCRGAGARTRRPVPMIAFHGTADPVVPYTGGKTWVAAESVSSHPHVDGELGATKPLRAGPDRLRRGGERHPPHLHWVRGRCVRGALHDPRRRPRLARRPCRCPNGCAGRPATASMPRARCGRSFASTGFAENPYRC